MSVLKLSNESNVKCVKVGKCHKNLTAEYFSNPLTRTSSKLFAICAMKIHVWNFLKIENYFWIFFADLGQKLF